MSLRDVGAIAVWLYDVGGNGVAHRARHTVDVARATNAHELRRSVLARLPAPR